MAAIISPMMTLFEQRGSVSKDSYLIAILLHQLGYLMLVSIGILIAWVTIPDLLATASLTYFGALAVFCSTQLQDLARRVLFVLDRPFRAFACDVVAYAGRLVALGALAHLGELDLSTTWWMIVAPNLAALLLIAPDVLQMRPTWPEIRKISRRHSSLAGWLVGVALSQWIGGNLLLIIIGVALGAEALGTLRAVQNLIGPVNLIIQSLENFAPSAASRVLRTATPRALRQYINRTAISGTVFFSVGILIVVPVLPNVIAFFYGTQFPSQTFVWTSLGLYAAVGFAAAVFMAGLRALGQLQSTFWFQIGVGLLCLPITWLAAAAWGLPGAVGIYLGSRVATASQLGYSFLQKTEESSPPGRNQSGMP
jgi:O-antigen/teichoic acid export membrane protein